MNVNDFYKELFEDVLGLDVMGLEYMYKDFVELINRRTIPAFSAVIPCIYFFYLDLDDPKNKVAEEYSRPGKEYYIDDPTLDALGIRVTGIAGYTLPQSDIDYELYMPQVENVGMMGMMLGSEATTSLSLSQSAMRYKKQYDLVGDRIVRLTYFQTNGAIELKLKTSYGSLAMITEDYKDAFMSLAKLDIKAKLYNELKYLEDVITPMGNLNLKISDWESAERDREDYYKELRTKSFPDRMIGGSYFTIL